MTSVREATRQVATALLPELPAIGAGTAAHIEAAMAEFEQRGLLEAERASCHANSSALLDALIRGVPLDAMAPSHEVMQSTRALFHGGMGLDAAMRAYRLGITYWCTRWAQAVDDHCPDDALRVRVVSHGMTYLLGWLEIIIDWLSTEYRDDVERFAREGSLARAADVRRVLIDDDLDVRAAGLRLGYDLDARHVALVLRRHDDATDAPLEAAARELASALSTARPLIVRVDVETTWCWVHAARVRTPPDLGVAVLVGVGRPGAGLDGFRASHGQACEALRVARLAGRGAGQVTCFDDIELAALCSTDPDRCRAFVAAELGPLAADSENARRLRATLAAFFDANSNFRATAARLGVHHNTVRYRLEQAETLLGRSPGEHRLPLELALHLASRVG